MNVPPYKYLQIVSSCKAGRSLPKSTGSLGVWSCGQEQLITSYNIVNRCQQLKRQSDALSLRSKRSISQMLWLRHQLETSHGLQGAFFVQAISRLAGQSLHFLFGSKMTTYMSIRQNCCNTNLVLLCLGSTEIITTDRGRP